VQRAFFVPLYAYDYLARRTSWSRSPPRAAEISPDGRTWTIRLKSASSSPTIRRARAARPLASSVLDRARRVVEDEHDADRMRIDLW